MNKGGFDQTGKEGGFRENIRDADKQRKLAEQDSIVKTEETLDRVVRIAEDDYRARPDDPPANDTFIRRLLERGRPEDLKRGRDVAKRAYEVTKQFRFRQYEGDITLRIASRKLQEYRDAAEKNKESQVAQQRYAEAQRQFAKMELDEFKARVEAYPTDLGLKYELARRFFNVGDMDNAIPLFQQSQDDAKRRVDSQFHLAQAFHKIDYIDESIHTYRTAMETHKLTTDEMGMGCATACSPHSRPRPRRTTTFPPPKRQTGSRPPSLPSSSTSETSAPAATR
jgi:tetratricopeptide (TPR) repeat protein